MRVQPVLSSPPHPLSLSLSPVLSCALALSLLSRLPLSPLLSSDVFEGVGSLNLQRLDSFICHVE